MRELNLLDSYPRSKRPIVENRAADPRNAAIARQFGREYFDGERRYGYGGYYYDGRWVAVAKRMAEYYRLEPGAWILDVGCAKGFLMHDFRQVVPGVHVFGLDISRYAIEQAMEDVRPYIVQGNAADLPFPDDSFDLVVAINTVHNLPRADCLRAIREVERVSRAHKYIQVDSWLTEEQRQNAEKWVLTADTLLPPDGWRELFEEAGYTGEYYWTLTG